MAPLPGTYVSMRIPKDTRDKRLTSFPVLLVFERRQRHQYLVRCTAHAHRVRASAEGQLILVQQPTGREDPGSSILLHFAANKVSTNLLNDIRVSLCSAAPGSAILASRH